MDNVRTGWLSPTGEFFPCESYEHQMVAEKLCESYGINQWSETWPADELRNKGWCSISIMVFLDHGYAIVFPECLPSPEQLRFLRPYYEGEYGLEMTTSSKHEYEEYLELL